MSQRDLSLLSSSSPKARTLVVTGANSGIGFEAAAQLAQAGFSKVILACRTLAKAERAREQLAARIGRDVFEVLEIDVSNIASANAAADELVARGEKIDALLLNAGMVSGPALRHSVDGLEEAFAASVVGHHVLTRRLLEAKLVTDGGRIVIAGSEGANGDLPAMMDMKPYDFAIKDPTSFGSDLHEAMVNFAKGAGKDAFNPFRHYAATKLFVAWWAAALARRELNRVSVFAVSPGSSMRTNASRHQRGVKKFMFAKVMPLIAPLIGMDQSVEKAAKRYVDVLLDKNGVFLSGRTYTSKPNKVVGPLQVVEYAHVRDEVRQELAWQVLEELTSVDSPGARVRASA